MSLLMKKYSEALIKKFYSPSVWQFSGYTSDAKIFMYFPLGADMNSLLEDPILEQSKNKLVMKK